MADHSGPGADQWKTPAPHGSAEWYRENQARYDRLSKGTAAERGVAKAIKRAGMLGKRKKDRGE